ncbi:Uncharacterised protein [uncultured archaeon]|nr:Uncharacterised protein [uncultured archaeon]
MVLGIGEGKVELILDKGAYVAGDPVKGKVTITLNQPLAARELRAEFFGEIERHSGKHRHIDRIFEVHKVLGGEKTYSSGEAFDFELVTPVNAVAPKPQGVVMGVLSMFTPTPRWYVKVSLDMPMKFDINKRIQVQLMPARSP